MPQIALTTVPFRPSASLTGGEIAIYRGANLMPRGVASSGMYLEAYAGSLNLAEPIPAVAISGTITFSTASNVITGTATDFLDELHIGQMILSAGGEPLVVARLVSQTSFVSGRVPTTDETNVAAVRLPILFALDVKRGAQLRGNALHFDRGTILNVGSGIFYVNGAVLAGESLTATRQVQVALYNSTTNNYDVQSLGFEDIPLITNTAVTITTGGTKNTSLGFYSFKVAYYSDITQGYSNPTDTLLAGGLVGYEIIAANSRFIINFTADVATRPAKATGYIIYATSFSGSSVVSAVNAIQGAWFELARVPFTDLVAQTYTFDYVDDGLSATITSFDNDAPPDAEFLGTLDRYPFLISTNGQGVNSTGRELTTSPGAFVSPAKPDNLDAYPSTFKVPTEKGEVIIGQVSAAGRLFVMTANTLQAVTPTGLLSAPFTCRPFWKRGFSNPYNLIFVDDTLYGFSGKKMFRSIATGDSGKESHDFASDVETQMIDWSAGYVFLAHDPKNECIAVFSSAVRKNDAGYWETDVYLYSLTKYAWVTKVTLTDDTRDMIVSGVATVNQNLEFIAGGRRSGTTNQYDTWRFDSPTGVGVPWYLCFTMMDSGVELTAKVIKRLRPKGKFTSARLQLYGVTPDSDISITDLETGNNPILEIALDDSTDVHQYEAFKCTAKNLLMWTIRMDGTSINTGDDGGNEFHETVVNFELAGQVR